MKMRKRWDMYHLSFPCPQSSTRYTTLCQSYSMYGWMDGRMDGCKDARMQGCKDVCIHGCMDARMQEFMDGCMHGCMDGCIDGWMHAWMHGCMDTWMQEFMDGCMGATCMHGCVDMHAWVNEWVSEWMNEWMNEWVSEWMNEWMNEGRTNERINEPNKRTNERTNEWRTACTSVGISICTGMQIICICKCTCFFVHILHFWHISKHPILFSQPVFVMFITRCPCIPRIYITEKNISAQRTHYHNNPRPKPMARFKNSGLYPRHDHLMNLKNATSDFIWINSKRRLLLQSQVQFSFVLPLGLYCIFCHFAFALETSNVIWGKHVSLMEFCSTKKLLNIWFSRYERRVVHPHVSPIFRRNFRPPALGRHQRRARLRPIPNGQCAGSTIASPCLQGNEDVQTVGHVSPIFPLSPIFHPLHELTNIQDSANQLCPTLEMILPRDLHKLDAQS